MSKELLETLQRIESLLRLMVCQFEVDAGSGGGDAIRGLTVGMAEGLPDDRDIYAHSKRLGHFFNMAIRELGRLGMLPPFYEPGRHSGDVADGGPGDEGD